MIEVYRNLATVECAVINDNSTICIGIKGACRGEEVAVLYGNVIDTCSTSDVYTLDIGLAANRLTIAVGEVDVYRIVGVTLAP